MRTPTRTLASERVTITSIRDTSIAARAYSLSEYTPATLFGIVFRARHRRTKEVARSAGMAETNTTEREAT